MRLAGPRPFNAADLRFWLEHYQDWKEELEAGGLYTVDPGGTSVRSNRAGRPTESAALNQAHRSEQIRVIETWLGYLGRPGSPQRLMAEYYLTGGLMTVRAIARELDLPYGDVAATIRILPALIYLEWYGEENS